MSYTPVISPTSENFVSEGVVLISYIKDKEY